MAFALALCLTLVTPAQAQYSAPQFRVYNQGSTCIAVLNVEPHNYSAWGPDLLGSYELCPNQFYRPLAGLNLPSCWQDVRAVYTDGHIEYHWDINVCGYNLWFYY